MKKFVNLIILFFVLVTFTGCTSKKTLSQNIAKNPSEQKFVLEEVGSLNIARANHSATLLNNGNVLLLGGSGGQYSNITGEIYNPKTKLTSFVQNYSPLDIKQNKPILLNNGNVIIFCPEGIVKYDANFSKFILLKKYQEKRSYNTIAKLLNNNILIIRGYITGNNNYNIAEIYKPKTNSMKQTNPPKLKRSSLYKAESYIYLKNNKLLLLNSGTSEEKHFEVFNTANNNFKIVDKYPKLEAKNEFNYIPEMFLLYNSEKHEYTSIKELFKTQNKELGENLPFFAEGNDSLLLSSKIILLLSPYNNNPKDYTKVYSFDILSKKFEYLGDLQLNYQAFAITKLSNNKILISGGYHYDGSDEYKSIDVKRNVVMNIKNLGE